MKNAAAVILVLVLASLGLAACGGGSSSTSTAEQTETTEPTAKGGTAGSGAQVDLEANPEGQLVFEEKSATAKAGKDTIDFTNQSAVPHNVTIEAENGKVIAETETLAEGSTSAVADLKPGTYTFFCSVPGHREAGMEGTLTVK